MSMEWKEMEWEEYLRYLEERSKKIKKAREEEKRQLEEARKKAREIEERRLEKARKKAKEVEEIIRECKSIGREIRAYPWKEIFKRIYKKEMVWYIKYELDYDVINSLSKDTLIFIRDVLRDMLYFLREFYPKLPGIHLDEEIWDMVGGEERLYTDVHILNRKIIERTKKEMEKYRRGRRR